ncbi:hypothetical protein [Chroococcidiopsis sp. SAG 2025]|uniref:hypothetical protein n=1 Tax=Chroococcidiopsis sp. SAG 2025 TaxID=171389 RepID=UPI00293749A1|nr:hypothetical protein [Chroococcidiopsis sp. SAG 2025]
MLLSLPLVWFFVEDKPHHSYSTSDPELVNDSQGGDYKQDWRFWLITLGGALNAFCTSGLSTGQKL